MYRTGNHGVQGTTVTVLKKKESWMNDYSCHESKHKINHYHCKNINKEVKSFIFCDASEIVKTCLREWSWLRAWCWCFDKIIQMLQNNKNINEFKIYYVMVSIQFVSYQD